MSDSIDAKQEVNPNMEQQESSQQDPAEFEKLLKARDEFKQDMFKYKEAAKSAQAELQRLRDEASAREEEQLLKQEEYKTLYGKERQKREELEKSLQADKKKFIDSSKINAVMQELGGLKSPEYSRFIQPDLVDLGDDGSIMRDSLMAEVDRIKQNYPELLKASAPAKLPDAAPKATAPEKKSLKQLSSQELLSMYGQVSNKSK